MDERVCPKLSTGDDSTLGNWRKLCAFVFGAGSASVAFFDDKIAEQGEDEWVLQDEQQMMVLVFSLEGR